MIKTSLRFILQAFLMVCLLSPGLLAQDLQTANSETVGMSSARLERISHMLQQQVDQGKLSGAVALVARRGKIAYLQAFGKQDLENAVPMQESTIFRIASQTKAIVSVGVMILQEEGKLLITDPVGKYMPEFQETTVAVAREDGDYDVVKAHRPITIRDLLTHTAGIGYGGGIASDVWEKADIQGWYFAHRDEPIQATVKRMASLPMEAHPGERFVYGYNTDILGALIEVVSGESLDVFLRSRMLEPLGMDDTYFYLPRSKSDRLAVVYSSTDEGLEKAPDPGGMVGQGAYLDGPRKSFSGGAGYLSTATDYARFLQMMLNGGAFNGKRILSRKTVELMTVSHIADLSVPWETGTGFGLGFSILEKLGSQGLQGSVGSYSWGGAYHSTYWIDPKEELVVTYFTQLIPAREMDDHPKLKVLVYQAIVD